MVARGRIASSRPARRPSPGSLPFRGGGAALPAAALAAILAAALLSLSCGDDFTFEATQPTGDPSPVAATYDIESTYPDFEFPEFAATGLSLDLTLEIDPDSVASPDGTLNGSVTIHHAKVGGVGQSFQPQGAIPFTGRLTGNQIHIEFGPITVGMTTLSPYMDGLVSPRGRRMDGLARFGNITEQGSWFGIKQRRYLIAGSGYGLQGTASIITVRFDTRFLVDRDVELISGDPVTSASGEIPFIINRFFFDNVQILDPLNGFLTAIQFSTGNGSNPHDALAAGPGRVYVTRYEPAFNDILIADPNTGTRVGSIPLGSLATNSSGAARPDRLVEVNGMVMVTLQNVDATFLEYGPGLVAFVDPATDGIVDAVTLQGQNPFGPPSIHPKTHDVYVAAAGIFQGLLPQELSGGIEVIDPISLTTRGLLVDDDDLGGNVSAVAVTSAGRGYAVVVTASGTNSLVAFDPADGSVQGTVLSTAAFIPEIRYDGDGYLLVAENDFGSPALRVLDAAAGREIVRIPLSLPPVSLAILTRGLLAGN
jgi:hypothetical protein